MQVGLTHLFLVGHNVDAASIMQECDMQMDKKLEDALRTSVRRSLQEMSRALNGDKRLEVAPLFIVSLHLDDTKRIELRPTVQVSCVSEDSKTAG